MSNQDPHLTRRSVLRKTAIVSVAAGVGIPTVSGTAAASYCPRTPGYWKNHDWPRNTQGDPVGVQNVNDHIPGVDFADQEEGQAFLAEPKRGDKGKIMVFHLIAYILNNQGACDPRKNPDTTTLPGAENLDGITTLQDLKREAQNWVRDSNFPDPQRTWHVPDATVSNGEVMKDLLDQLNNNQVLPCDCSEYDGGNSDEDTGSDGSDESGRNVWLDESGGQNGGNGSSPWGNGGNPSVYGWRSLK